MREVAREPLLVRRVLGNYLNNTSDTSNSDLNPADDRPDKDQARQAEPRIIGSGDLFKGNRVIQIRHGGEIYTLRQTRLGKLILNK